MLHHSVYLGSDAALYRQLVEFWQARLGTEIGYWSTDSDSETEISRATRWLIDVRQPDLLQRLMALAEQPAGWRIPSQIIVLHDGSFSLAAACFLSLLGAVPLQVPFVSGQLDEVISEWQEHPPAAPWKLFPQPRSVAGQTIHFTTRTPALFPVLEQLERIAPHDVTLLLIGETGTGKTTLAHLVHELSPRCQERFMTVACGALPADLIESELFGHVRGAFTGAERAKIGRFEAAERGTLLLDEIDVLSAREQTRLLRVIETGEFEPVGSSETRTTNSRLVVAANVDLKELTERNQFRSDLYYRLNVLEFHLPPLRQRPLDIVPLTVRFVEEFSREHAIPIEGIEPEFITAIRQYPWPGNLRELKNQIRRAVLFARQGILRAQDLAVKAATTTPTAPVVTAEPVAIVPPSPTRLSDQVADREREILMEALRAHNFKRTAAARFLGISRVGLYKKMRKYGLLTPNSGDGAAEAASEEAVNDYGNWRR